MGDNEVIKMAMNKKLKDIRSFRNITQQALSDATGISVRLIQKYESGERVPKDDNLEKLARALNVNNRALTEPSLVSYEDVMFTLFELEKEYGEITLIPMGGKTAICIDSNGLNDILMKWKKAKEERSKESLEEWQLTYPRKEIMTMRKGEFVHLDDE